MVLKFLLVCGRCVFVANYDRLDFLSQLFDSGTHFGIIRTVCLPSLGIASARSRWITLPAITVSLFIVDHGLECLGGPQIQRTYIHVGFVREATGVATFQFQYHIYIRLTEQPNNQKVKSMT